VYVFRRIRVLHRFLYVCVAMLLAAACSAAPDGDSNQPAAQTAPTSTPFPTAPAVARPTYVVQRGSVEEVFEFSGRWLPRDQSSLAFEINGQVRRVEIRRGDTVSAGQLLADLQITELENQLASAQLELEAAQRGLQTGSEGSVQTVADAEIALANAQLRLQSARDGAPWPALDTANNAIESAERDLAAAQRAYDDAISRPDTAASTVDSLYDQLQSAHDRVGDAWNSYYSSAQQFNNHEYSIAEAENAVIQAQINLDNARQGIGIDPSQEQALRSVELQIEQINAQIQRSSLYAPIDGEVLEVNVQPGDAVEAFQAVIVVGRDQPHETVASLAIGDAQRLSVGQIGVCQVINQPESAVQCVVRQLPLSARDADQTTRIAASLELTAPELQTGQVIEVFMPLQVRENVLWLPPAAIRTFQNRTFVVLQTADGPQRVDVEIGLQTEDRVEIISGVEEGDIVEAP
jgi:multidrug efflux pump subunit AcrA (membrane-fusion protein)